MNTLIQDLTHSSWPPDSSAYRQSSKRNCFSRRLFHRLRRSCLLEIRHECRLACGREFPLGRCLRCLFLCFSLYPCPSLLRGGNDPCQTFLADPAFWFRCFRRGGR